MRALKLLKLNEKLILPNTSFYFNSKCLQNAKNVNVPGKVFNSILKRASDI